MFDEGVSTSEVSDTTSVKPKFLEVVQQVLQKSRDATSQKPVEVTTADLDTEAIQAGTSEKTKHLCVSLLP
jgi:hypothetical protein